MSTEPTDGQRDSEVVPVRAVEAPTETALAETPPPVYADLTASSRVPGTRRPIIPEQWHPENIRATLRQLAELHWHKSRYHGVRAPWYTVNWLWCAVVGVKRLIHQVGGWAFWPNGWLLEHQAVAAGRTGHKDAMAAHQEHFKTLARNTQIAGACLVFILAVVLVILVFVPRYGQVAIAVVVFTALVRHGRPVGKPIVKAAVVPERFQPPTPEIITRALGSLGIPGISAAIKAGPLDFKTDVHRDGPGWGAVIDLPHGVTVTQVLDKREELASGLRRPLSATWPEPGPEHTGRLHLWIGFEDLSKTKPVPWPLKRGGTANLFSALPFGADQRGRPISITLMFASILIGAMPRMGKTMALRILALAAALDVTVRLRVWELKGTGDLAALRDVAHEYGSGADDETLQDCLQSVRGLYAELERRAKVIKGLPEHLVPENKVTPQLAGCRDLGLFPEVFIIDECQEAYSDPVMGKDFDRLTTAIVKRGPALGIILLLATQRPDKESLPKSISANIGIRFCLRVMGPYENNAVLGAGMYAKGYRATDLALSDKGIGYLAGHADEVQVVKTCYLNAVDAKVIGPRARQLREAAGTLSGYALSEDATAPARNFLADVLQVFGGDDKLWSPTIAARLAGQIPGAYEGIIAEAVASQLRNAGVTVKDVREASGANRKGCERAAVEAVAANPRGAQ
jgi:S-DNA-T family DNA segregation ATPase FtsK/SpoIIIE